MKVAITARGPSLECSIDESFGRAYWIMIFDTQTGEVDALDNSEIRNVLQGAGEKVGQWLSDLGVGVVITGKVGPKALRQLKDQQIKVFHGAAGTVTEALGDWKKDRLSQAEIARCEGSPFCLINRNYSAASMERKVELRLVKS